MWLHVSSPGARGLMLILRVYQAANDECVVGGCGGGGGGGGG